MVARLWHGTIHKPGTRFKGTRFKGAGIGIGIGMPPRLHTGGGGAAPWTLADLTPALWLDPVGTPASVTYAAQPTPADWDMEAAGVTAWPHVSGAYVVRSKEAGSPGGSGSQVLRLTCTGITSELVYCGQTVLTTHAFYRIKGWGRSDGTYAPCVRSPLMWTGTASSTWQSFDELGSPGGTELYLGTPAYVSGTIWFEFDDLDLDCIAISALDPTSSTLTDGLVQITAYWQPYIDPTSGWLVFPDGYYKQADYGGSAGDFKFLHYSATNPGNYPSFTVISCISPNRITALQTILYTGDSPGFKFQISGSSTGGGLVNIYGSGVTLASAIIPNGTFALNTKAIVIIIADGSTLKVYVDGTEVVSTSFANTVSSSDPPVAMHFGYSASAEQARAAMADTLLVDRAISATERGNAFTYLSTKLGITI